MEARPAGREGLRIRAGVTLGEMHMTAAPDRNDRTDFEDADRGFVGRLDPGIVKAADGRVVWDNDVYAFLDGRRARPPPTRASGARASSSPARASTRSPTASTRCAASTCRTCRSSRATPGVIVIDPLISAETAAAALALYRTHRGDRPVIAVIYTPLARRPLRRGAAGSTDGRCRSSRPAGFLEHAVSENVYAGVAMNRRAIYMYGAVLEKGPAGQIGAGLGHDDVDRHTSA